MGRVGGGQNRKARHDPLGVQILADRFSVDARKRTDKEASDLAKDEEAFVEDEDMMDRKVPEKLAKKILASARMQQLEEESESAPMTRVSGTGHVDVDELSDSDFSDAESIASELSFDEGDEDVLASFMPEGEMQRSLADIIMEKIEEQRQMQEMKAAAKRHSAGLDPKVIKVYRGVGELLSKYKSGKLPKAFKILPQLVNFEEILYVTEPDKWTTNAMHKATILFANNLNDRMAQRFFNTILLPAVRDDIRENNRLNFHLFSALRRALWKPAAFYKGILLPLCESGSCTLKEAAIVGSVLAQTSVPVVHSSVAIMKIAEMQYSGANSMFLRVLLNKKYSLPLRVVDAVVQHFAQFVNDPRPLPVLWHQAFLVFAQRYKYHLTEEQLVVLQDVLRGHFHPQITPEIRRELQAGHEKLMEKLRDSSFPSTSMNED